MTAPNRLRTGVPIAALGNLFAPVAGLACAPILAYGLGVDGRGELAAVTAPLLLGMSILALGIPDVLTFRLAAGIPVSAGTLRHGAAALLAGSAVGSLCIWLSAPALSAGNGTIERLVPIAGLGILPCVATLALRGLAAGGGRWTLIAAEKALGSAVRVVGLAALALDHRLTVASSAFLIVLTTFVGGLVYIVGTRSAVCKLTRVEMPSGTLTGSFSSYALHAWAGSLAGITLARLDQVLMAPLAGVSELGLYAVAVTLAESILVINAAVRDVLFTLESETPDDTRLAEAARVSTVVTGALGLLLAAGSLWIVPWAFGPDFRGAITPLLILVAGTVLGNPGSVAGAGLAGRGRPGYRSVSLAGAVAANAAALLLLAPHFGASGAAAATLISNLVASALNVFWLRRLYGIRARLFVRISTGDIRMAMLLMRGIRSRRPAGRELGADPI